MSGFSRQCTRRLKPISRKADNLDNRAGALLRVIPYCTAKLVLAVIVELKPVEVVDAVTE